MSDTPNVVTNTGAPGDYVKDLAFEQIRALRETNSDLWQEVLAKDTQIARMRQAISDLKTEVERLQAQIQLP